MLKRIRPDLLTVVIFAVAFVVCGAAWMRFFWVAATQPSPVRYVTFMTPSGQQEAFRQDCAGPSFIEKDTVWRFCEYGIHTLEPSTAGTWGLVRFDLLKGRADLLWPLMESQTSQILALAQSPSGDLGLAWGSPALTHVYRVQAGGGIKIYDAPESAPPEVAGLAWAGDTLELATDSGDGFGLIYAYQDGTWQPPREVPRPDTCDEESVCTLQFARRESEGWRFLYARAPVAIPDPAAVPVEVVSVAEDGSQAIAGTIPLSNLAPEQASIENGRLTRLGMLFDRSPGNVVNWSLEAAPWMMQGETWEQITPPVENASFYFSDYQIGPDGLRWIPGLRYPQKSCQLDTWLMLKASGDGVKLATMTGDAGPTLTANTSFLRGDGPAQTSILPASDGGYWILGPYGAYMKADQSMHRVDNLSVFERTTRSFDNFGRFKVYNDDFHQQQSALKMIAFPLVLLSLPAGYLLVFFVRQSRRNTRAWVKLLVQVSVVYVLLATIFIWWFWKTMHYF